MISCLAERDSSGALYRSRARARTLRTAARRCASASSICAALGSGPPGPAGGACGARAAHPARMNARPSHAPSTAARGRRVRSDARRLAARPLRRPPAVIAPPWTTERLRRATPRAGALQIVDLAAQPFGLLRLRCAAERVAVDAQGLRGAPGLLVGVAEVLGDGGVVGRERDGTLEILDRLVVVAALEVHPAEAVDVEAVVRADGQRAADELFGFVEAHALLGVGVAEVVERRGVLRVDLDGALHVLDRARLVLALVVERAEGELVAVVVGVSDDQL